MKRLFEKYSEDLKGLFWLAFAIFVGVALFTYSPTDPSLNAVVKAASKPRNACGYVGSFLADLLYQGFGVSAWVIVLASARQALFGFTTKPSKKERTQWTLDVFLLLCVTCLLSLHFPETRFYANQVRIGGWLGYLLTAGLIRVVNVVGLAIMLWTCLAALLVFYTGRTWSEIVQSPRDLIGEWLSAAKTSIRDTFVGAFKAATKPALMRSKSGTPIAGPSFFKIGKSVPKEPEITVAVESKVVEAAPEPTIEAEIDEPFEPGEREGGLAAPITGFLKESFQTEKGKKTIVRIPRRVHNWELPKLSMLADPPSSRTRLDEKEIKNKARLLVEKLSQFSVRGEVVGIKPGPAVTMFEFKPAVDVKISKITDLADDLSLALSSESVRIIAPIPGRDVVGIETSNSSRESVFAKDIISQEKFWNDETKLPIALGRKADGEPRVEDLRKMPHLLVAGTTGSGKSVFIVSMITGLLFRHSPKTLKLILVDPKQVDLAAFNDLPHLVMPPIREAKKAVGALRWAIREMEKRYRSMSKFGARGLEAYNDIVEKFGDPIREQHQAANDALEGRFHPESYYFQSLPYIVIVVEEFGDLMVVDKVNVEQAVVRLAQMARACGIHLVLAMQSPRKDVVTGLIKTNIPGRISFKVASKMDSRIILDEGGAERLLARGDMLFLAPGVSKPERHHGPYLSEDEIGKVVENWKVQGEPEYDELAMKAIEGSGGGLDVSDSAGNGGDGDPFDDDATKDDRYDEILAWVSTRKEVSASLLQRMFKLGYPRAARMIETFTAEGVVGPANGSKPRQVLIREMPN